MHVIETGEAGGAETVFCQLAHSLEQRGARSIVVVPREGWVADRVRSIGMRPLIMGPERPMSARFLLGLVATVRKNRVGLIISHLPGASAYAAATALITGTPVISVLHGPTDLRAIGKFPAFKRWLLEKGCSAIVAVSASTRDALSEFGLPRDSITLIPNGVDTDAYSPGERVGNLRAELGVAAGEMLVGAVGNIRPPKAYDVLLAAAAKVLARVPACRFAILGEGDESSVRQLHELRRSLGIEARCHLVGFRQSSGALYRDFDVFVSSSRSEGLSLSFLEAMASGLAVVATRSGGPQEVLESDGSGILVPIEDPDALAEGLVRALREPALRHRLGESARRQVVESFSLRAALDRYAELCEEVAGDCSWQSPAAS